MNYEITELQDKAVAGLRVRTNNLSPDMGDKIGGLWKQFYETGVYSQIPGKVNAKSMGLYTNYAGDHKDDYDLYVCCEVEPGTVLPDTLSSVTIPGGRYAKFILKGAMLTVVQEFWVKLWEMKLDRKFDSDFEEYQPSEDGNMELSEIHMFISLK